MTSLAAQDGSRMLVGLLRSRKDLERALAQFGSAGWHRSDLSLLSKHNVLLPDYLTVQTARVAEEDAALNSVSSAWAAARKMRIFIAAGGGVVAALVAGAITVLLGGSELNAGIVAALAGAGTVALAELLGHRIPLLRKYTVPEQGRYSGILLWVRVDDPKQEKSARGIFRRLRAAEVRWRGANPVVPVRP